MDQKQLALVLISLLLGSWVFFVFSLTVGSLPASASSSTPRTSFVIASDPIDGSTVAHIPSVVRLTFNEPISSVSTALVFNAQEQLVNASHSVISVTNPGELDTPLLHPDHLPQGSYLIRWAAVSLSDARATHGVIGFDVGYSSTGLPGQVIVGPSTSNILPELDLFGGFAVLWEWMSWLALTFWIGVLCIERFFGQQWVRNGQSVWSLHLSTLLLACRKQSLSIQRSCLLSLLLAECLVLALRVIILSTYTLDFNNITFALVTRFLVSSTYGWLWLTRLFAIGAALLLLKKRPVLRTQHISALFCILALLLLLSSAYTDDIVHLSSTHLSALAFSLLYMFAWCLCFGGDVYLIVIFFPIWERSEIERKADVLKYVMRHLRRFFRFPFGLLLLSQVFRTEISLSRIDQFWTDRYGRVLLIQWGLLLLFLLVGTYTLFLFQPTLPGQFRRRSLFDPHLPQQIASQYFRAVRVRSIKRLLYLQTYLGAGALLCLALLSFFAPPIQFPDLDYHAASDVKNMSSTGGAQQQSQVVGDMTVTLQAQPAKVNIPTTIVVQLADTQGQPITDAQVHLSSAMVAMNMGVTEVPLQKRNTVYTTILPRNVFSMTGAWNIELKILRPHHVVQSLMTRIVINP